MPPFVVPSPVDAVFWRVFRFELRRAISRPGLWVASALFFALGFATLLLLAGVGEPVGLTLPVDGGEALALNSPYVVHTWISVLTFFGLILSASLFGNAAGAEHIHRLTPLLWTTQLTRPGAWWGRFAAALVANLAVLSGVGLGLWAGSRMPGLDPTLFGPATLYGYVAPYLLTVLPRTLLPAAVAYVLVSRTRNPLSGYLAVVGVIGLFTVSRLFLRQIESHALAALLDPTGGVSWRLVTDTWSTAEKNHQVVGWTGLVLASRLLWAGVATVVLLFGHLTFRPEAGMPGAAPVPLGGGRGEPAERRRASLPGGLRSLAGRLPLTLRLALSEYRAVVFHTGFLVSMAMMALLFFLVILVAGSNLGGTPAWPTTAQVADALTAVVTPFHLALLLAFSGFLLWRERTLRADSLLDSLPRPHWQPLVSKSLALALVAATIQGFAILLGLAYQTSQGYFHYQLGVYAATFLGFGLTDSLLLLAVALFFQALLPRYAAYLATVTLYLGVRAAPAAGFDHGLYLYGANPGLRYSELNGWAPFLTGWLTTQAYWASIAGLLFVATGLLFRRGVDIALGRRLRLAPRNATPTVRAIAAALGLTATALGGWIFYNTNVLHPYLRPAAAEAARAELERRYRPRLADAEPRIVDTDLAVDLFPSAGRARIRGTYRLANPTGQPIATALLALNPALAIHRLELSPPAVLAPARRNDPYRQIRFRKALQPGETAELHFDLELAGQGFANRQEALEAVLPNGTFLQSGDLLPAFGYDPRREISDPRRRRKLGLPRRDPFPPADDPFGRANPTVSVDADRTPFHAVVSTAGDQVAFAPGDLVKKWEEGGRRYFEYRSARPIFKLYAFVSGRYSLLRGRAGGVEVEIYHHPDHAYNVATLMRAAQATLTSLSARFGAYPHQALRIVEFPRYATFAQSFPALILVSEDYGWTARRQKPEDLDYPLYITAHEVAHQWWGHQVAAARVQGATFLVETLAQDAALRVMEELLGKPAVGRFLRYELDLYLTGRAAAVRDEGPLLRVQNQEFLHYRKGSLVMANLTDLLGRGPVDAALAAFAARYSWTGPPYPIARDLYAELQARTPPKLRNTLADLFERTTLFDLETTRAACRPLPGGRYQVSFDVQIAKGYADGIGNLKPAPLDDWIDVAVLAAGEAEQDKGPKPLVLDKRELRAPTGHFTFTVDEKPVRAGLDPFSKIIDLQPENNTRKLYCGG